MRKKNLPTDQVNEMPRRRLSCFRVLLALLILAGMVYYSVHYWQEWEENKIVVGSASPWFAPYVDVTATPQYEFEKLGTTPARHIVLSFIVSSSSDPCVPTWGNAYTLDKASVALDLDRRIARLRQLGGDVAVSFGGLLNDELAINCTDTEKLMKAYQLVIERYDVDTLDFDIEGESLLNIDASKRRAVTLAALQQKLRDENKDIAVWLTLPVAPQGLTEGGTNAVAQMLMNGVDLAGINVMTMDYGSSRVVGQSMQQATEAALVETHRQLGILYAQAGINLNSASLWKKIGATPMIGQNDVLDEIFTLDDAEALNEYALERGIIRISMWSANRDIQCGSNYVNLSIVSDSCSGVKQDPLGYTLALSKGMDGNFRSNVSATVEDPELDSNQLEDDPKNSPYRIWNEQDTYLGGTKVVWHRNVYQAKWWTQGDLPDNPVLQSWQTPWQLIGPVLPGETPVELITLPEGTYPEWSGTTQYDAGYRVLFNGIGYQAKWWTQGDSPAAAASNPTSSPWIALTPAQMEEILKKLN